MTDDLNDVNFDVNEFVADMQKEYAIWAGEREEFVLYTEDEYDAIMEAAALGILGNHGGEMDEEDLLEEVMAVVRWAEEIATGSALVDLILKERVIVFPSEETRPPTEDMMFKIREDSDGEWPVV